jgi:hypothetical protein
VILGRLRGTTTELVKAGIGQGGSLILAQDNAGVNSLQVASNGVATLGTPGTYPGQVVLAGATGGATTLQASATAGGTIAFPAVSGTANAVTTADSGTVTNSMLAHSSTTVNGQTCTLGLTCTVSGAPSGTAGGDLTGSYPNPTVANVNGVAYPASPSANTVPVATGASAVTYEPVPNAALANSSITLQGSVIALGGSALATTSVPQFSGVGLGTVAASAATPLVITPPARTSGSPNLVTITAPVDTTLADAELNDLSINLSSARTFTGGSGFVKQRAVLVSAPTYAEGAAQTIAEAATVAVNGVPQAGTNATLTYSYGLWIEAPAVGSGVTNAVALRVEAPSGASNDNYSAAFAGPVTFNSKATITNGVWTTYNNATVTGMGTPPIYQSVSSPGNTGSITTTNLQCGGSVCLAGTYRATVYMVCTTAGTSSSDTLAVTLGWNDGTASRTATAGSNGMPANIICNATNFAQGSTILQADGSHNITYAFALGATTGSPVYAVYVNLERLQ